ncbi:hypothetical protein STEG23_018054 [Scotinomys teguina]
MQPGRATNNGCGTMEVVAATSRSQMLLIVLMAVMLLPGMKVSLLLVQRTVTKTIGKGRRVLRAAARCDLRTSYYQGLGEKVIKDLNLS